MSELKRQVYLSVEQYNTLKSEGSITVDGVTIEFSENDEYITPDTTGADITAVRQELLGKIQKKADTSYVDEQIESVSGATGDSITEYACLLRMLVEDNENTELGIQIIYLSFDIPYDTIFDDLGLAPESPYYFMEVLLPKLHENYITEGAYNLFNLRKSLRIKDEISMHMHPVIDISFEEVDGMGVYAFYYLSNGVISSTVLKVGDENIFQYHILDCAISEKFKEI